MRALPHRPDDDQRERARPAALGPVVVTGAAVPPRRNTGAGGGHGRRRRGDGRGRRAVAESAVLRQRVCDTRRRARGADLPRRLGPLQMLRREQCRRGATQGRRGLRRGPDAEFAILRAAARFERRRRGVAARRRGLREARFLVPRAARRRRAPAVSG